MIPAVFTGVLAELTPTEAARALAGIGWPGLELSTEHLDCICAAERSEEVAEELRAVVEDLGVAMPQAHLFIDANVCAADPEVRQHDMARLMREIEQCARMGISVGVVHPGGQHPARGEGPATLSDERQERERRLAGFKRLAEHAAEHGVTIAIENMWDALRYAPGPLGRRVYGATIPELHELIHAIGMPNVGICLDVGHANIQGLDMAEAVRQCGDRLVATHMADNDGTRDRHLAPTRGTVDWQSGVAALREIGYAGLFNLEISGERGVPLELVLKRLEGALAVTRWLLGEHG